MPADFPLPSTFNSRGSGPQQDYSWSDETIASSHLLAFAPQSGPGILIGSTDQSHFTLMLCNLDAARTDFRQRRIRTTLGWDGLDEPQARSLATRALECWSELESIVQQTVLVTPDELRGWKVIPDALAHWLQTLHVPDATSALVSPRRWRSSGPPNSPAWQDAISQLRSTSLPPERLAFILSPDPNPAEFENLKHNAACLLIEGGPQTWENLQLVPQKQERKDRTCPDEVERAFPLPSKEGLQKLRQKGLNSADKVKQLITNQLKRPGTKQVILLTVCVGFLFYAIGWNQRDKSAQRELDEVNKAHEIERAEQERQLLQAKQSNHRPETDSSPQATAR